MQLYLCRHGEAIDGTDDLEDEERWLTQRGRVGVAEVGAILREQGDVPDLILTSPLVRATQTAHDLAHALGYLQAIEVLPALAPGGVLGAVLDALDDLSPEQRGVFLVGHEPQMSEWAATLLGRASFGRAFSKGGVLRMNWTGRPKAGTGRGAFYLSPAQLRPVPV